jgi:hypothetical protein
VSASLTVIAHTLSSTNDALSRGGEAGLRCGEMMAFEWTRSGGLVEAVGRSRRIETDARADRLSKKIAQYMQPAGCTGHRRRAARGEIVEAAGTAGEDTRIL